MPIARPLTSLTLASALVASIACLASVGCAAPVASDGQNGDADTVGTQASALVESNGTSLNGRDLNGHKLNGMSLNGHKLNGHKLNGRTLDGVSVHDVRIGTDTVSEVSLDGTWLDGRGERGRRYKKRAFVGAHMTGLLDDGSTIPVRIDDIERGDGDDRDVQRYTLSFETDEGWQPYCGRDARGAAVRAIPLEGRWNYGEGPGGGAKIDGDGSLTFACDGYVLAKCVDLGYKPWKSVTTCSSRWSCQTISLAAHHQACTRMLRADYCGDGRAHTVDGTLINVYDGIGIQRDTDPWSFEAEWTEGGARCVSRGRTERLPACAEALADPSCGARSHFASGTLLMSEDSPDVPVPTFSPL